MKLFLSFALVCLLAVAYCKKLDNEQKGKYHSWSQKKGHHVKKYQEKVHHHDKYLKTHSHETPLTQEFHSTEKKQPKVEAHHGVPQHEAELQEDIKSSKKEIADRLAKDEQDLHLQDLTHPDDPANADHKSHKSPHQYQRGHHKANHQFSHPKGQKTHHHPAEKEEKLFVFPEPEQPESKQAHSVLEDTFEALDEEIVQEQPQHSQPKKKDSNRNKKSHKKAYEKVKEKTKNKESEKTKSKQHKVKKEKKQY